VVQELRWFIGDTQAHYDAAGVVTKTYAHVALGTPVARVERTANVTTAKKWVSPVRHSDKADRD
jgi:hypothetical protein